MIVTLHILEEFSEYDKWVENMNGYMYFRGQSNYKWPLIPSIGRCKTKNGKSLTHVFEKAILREFKKQARTYVQDYNQSEFDWLATAQHHGLPTRLLDWTRNPLVALYFSVYQDRLKDGAVYALKSSHSVAQETIKDPFTYKKLVKIKPFMSNKRMIAQDSRFTLHNNPTEIYNSNEVYRIKIHAKSKRKILDKLAQYGITSQSLFPDLTGIANHIKFSKLRNHLNG